MLDETHHLLHPGRYSKQLDSLGACLLTAKRTVAVGFTGTLVLDEASEGQKLLDIIKGGKGTCDEGARWARVANGVWRKAKVADFR